MDLISGGRENTGNYFPSLHIDRGAAEVNMAREIIKPVFSRPGEIRVLSQEDWSLTTDFSFYSKSARRKRRVSV